MFSGCIVPPDSKETEPGSSNQEASLPAGKNNGVDLAPCPRKEVHPNSHFRWQLFPIDKFSVRVTKITSRIGVS